MPSIEKLGNRGNRGNEKKEKNMVNIKRCRKCDAVWGAHIEHPIKCPRCQSKLWDREDKRKGPKEFKERNRPTMLGIEKLEVGQDMILPFIRTGQVGKDELMNRRRNSAIYCWAWRNGRKFTLDGLTGKLRVRRLI